jgi:hypothetical protein
MQTRISVLSVCRGGVESSLQEVHGENIMRVVLVTEMLHGTGEALVSTC